VGFLLSARRDDDWRSTPAVVDGVRVVVERRAAALRQAAAGIEDAQRQPEMSDDRR